MTALNDFLVELGTEELPPKALHRLAKAFSDACQQGLQKQGVDFAEIKTYATPRRLAMTIHGLAATTAEKNIVRQGPFVANAFDDNGQPTPACQGFARSVGLSPEALTTEETPKGPRLVHRFTEPGLSIHEFMPALVTQALEKLPIPKRMRWGNETQEFVRPVHWLVMLYGNEVIPADILGVCSDRITYGHRFHAPEPISLEKAGDYLVALSQAFVMPDLQQRKQVIRERVQQLAEEKSGKAQIDPDLLTEVTALVEWPVPMQASFSEDFLQVPAEALMSAMQDHQKCFPIVSEEGALKPYFIFVSNIESKDTEQLIKGNERVMQARLADAAFFYQTDLKHHPEVYLEQLKPIIFHAKLGDLHAKAERISHLAGVIAKQCDADASLAERAGLLAKTDLVSNMVGEFPELQGVMGDYYAKAHHEPEQVALAIREHYFPRFASDAIPQSTLSCAVALADRIDTLIGLFGINEPPTGEKDPFALRRQALAVLRIIIENQLPLDLAELLTQAKGLYKDHLPNTQAVADTLQYILERLPAWYQEQGITSEVVNAVLAKQITQPADFDRRLKAVQVFLQLPEAKALASANKRVSKILQKSDNESVNAEINAGLLNNQSEKQLADLLAEKQQQITTLVDNGDYQQILTTLASLREPVDEFFDNVMVLDDDPKIRANRLAILTKLRALFLDVADLSKL